MGHTYINCTSNTTELCDALISINQANHDLIGRLLILFSLLVLFIYMYWSSKNIEYHLDSFNFIKYIAYKYFIFVYLLLSPLYFLLLRVPFETFMLFIFLVYGTIFAISILLVSIWGKKKIFEFNTKDALNARRERQKYKE